MKDDRKSMEVLSIASVEEKYDKSWRCLWEFSLGSLLKKMGQLEECLIDLSYLILLLLEYINAY
jgi:hypothetical protein